MIGEVAILHAEPIPLSHFDVERFDDDFSKTGRKRYAKENVFTQIAADFFHHFISCFRWVANNDFARVFWAGWIVN